MGRESMPQPAQRAPADDAKLREERRIQEAREFLREWQLAEGLQVDDGGEKRVVHGHTPEHPNYPMTWNRNHDTLAAVGPDGKLFVTPYTSAAENKLRSLGFSQENLGVPLSNNEMPSHPDVKERWLAAQQKAKREKELEGEQNQ